MSFSLGSAIGAALGAGGDILSSTGWLSYSSAKSLNKKTLAQQVAAEKQLARELPSEQVEGLRDAGLNPILAIHGGISTPSVGNGSTGSGGSSFDNPAAEYLTLKNVANQNELLKAQKDSIDASTAKTYVDALNNIDTAGLGGPAGLAQRVGSGVSPSTTQEALYRVIHSNLERKFGVAFSHSAKDDEDMSIEANGKIYHFKKGAKDPYKVSPVGGFLRNGR